MNSKKLIAAGAIAAGVGIGSVAGAMFGSPITSGALEDTGSTSSAPASFATAAVAHGDGEVRGPGPGLDAAAEAIGITPEVLRTALQDGQTIAEGAAANGVDVQVVIDALVAQATARIDEAVADGDLTAEEGEERKANLVERVTELVNAEHPGRGFGHGRGGHRLALDGAAAAIGITEDELRAALVDGQTIAEVAAANGVDVQTVIDALVATATAHIDEEVAEGDLTAEEGEERKADLVERITDLVNRELPARGPGGPGHGPRGPQG